MKKLTALCMVAALVLALGTTLARAGETQQKLAQESMIEEVLKRGVLRVGMSTFVPWAMKDKKGELIGFEIDVAKELAKDMGVKVEFVPTAWDGIIPALLTGKFDVIIGGMSIRADRALKVNFSNPYDFSSQTICANKEKAKGFKTAADFNKPDVVVATRLGTSSTPAVKRLLPKAQLREFKDESALYQEVINGNVHAVVGSAPTPYFYALKNPEKLFAIEEPLTKEAIAFAVRKGDPDALTYFNNWIQIKWDYGFFPERSKYWFKTRDWADQVE